MTQSAAELLRKARKKLALNQTDFAKQFGKTQCTLSRYESGNVPPPSEVIMHCMHILNSDPTSDSVDDLIEKIGQLRGDKHLKLREALNALLDSYLSPH
ncbi:MAG: type II toxin-antitoxin system MqsA family antitoxin [Candidatus Thiodiazotropha sp. (ex Ctena orbiculata)]|nr:type II toxin-antitoxin system MqsA family antitoxin [Candidatus Thiodiazotropha taylori]